MCIFINFIKNLITKPIIEIIRFISIIFYFANILPSYFKVFFIIFLKFKFTFKIMILIVNTFDFF